MRYTLKRVFASKAGWQRTRVVGHINQDCETGEIDMWIRNPVTYTKSNKGIYLKLFEDLNKTLNKYFNLFPNGVRHKGMTHIKKGVRWITGGNRKET